MKVIYTWNAKTRSTHSDYPVYYIERRGSKLGELIHYKQNKYSLEL